ncbi:MAG: PAS domain-containing protein [Acidobacteriota bacterium]
MGLQSDQFHLELAVRAGNVGLWDWNLQTHQVLYSPEWKHQLGYEDHEISNNFNEWKSRVHSEDLPRVKALLARYLANPWPNYEVEFRMRHKDGSWRWILSQADLILDGRKQPVRMLGSHIDITERKRTGDLLSGQNKVLEMVAVGAPLPDTLTELIRVVEAQAPEMLCSILLLDEEGLRLRHGAAPSLPPDYSTALDGWAIGPRAGSCGAAAFHGEAVFVQDIAVDPLCADCRDLALRHELRSCWSSPIFDRERQILGTFAIYYRSPRQLDRKHQQLVEVATHLAAIAISRGRTETALRASEERLRLAVSGGNIGIWEWDVNKGRVTWNEQLKSIFGFSKGESSSQDLFCGAVHPDDRAATQQTLQMALETRMEYDHQFRILRPNGEVRWIVARGRGNYDEAGRPVSVVGVALDVTARKLAEEALHESSERLRTVIQSEPECVKVLGPNCVLLEMNPAGLRMLEADSLEEVVGQSVLSIVVPEHRQAFATLSEKVLGGESGSLQFEIEGLKGTRRWLETHAVPLRNRNGAVVSLLGITRDITDQKRAEKARQESEERFRQVTENINEVFWLRDLSGHVVYISPAYERIWGRTCDSLYLAPHSWMDPIHPEDKERVRNATRLQTEGSYDVEYRIIRPDGSVRWIHDRAFPVRDASGKIQRIAGVADDITTSRELEEQFWQAQKMDAVGQLAGGVAHDFNNLLTVVQMQTSLLLEQHSLEPEVRESIRDIATAAERAANLTQQLLTFSRRQIRQTRNLDLCEVVGGLTRLFLRVLGEDITLDTHFEADLPTVNADPGMMEQVLMNLAVNARDAMPNGGRLTISLESQDIGGDHVARNSRARAGRFVRLSVKDTGCGIASEILPRIFEPFFTTKEVGRGTGLGLATVFGIVEQHQGWIEVASSVGEGSTFRIFLPASETNDKPIQGSVLKSVSGGNETILIVEDEPSVRALARAVLERHGYRVLEAASATEGLKHWEASGGNVDLLLTDLILPGGMSGRELALKLLESKPQLKVIYSSGYSNDMMSQQLQLDPKSNFLQKPYPALGLAAAVRRRLDER